MTPTERKRIVEEFYLAAELNERKTFKRKSETRRISN